jgi:hypothetical protein
VVFLLIEFPLRQQKSVSFIFRCALIFVDTYAHTLFLEVNFIFHIYIQLVVVVSSKEKNKSRFKQKKGYLFSENFKGETTYCCYSKVTQMKMRSCYPNQKTPLKVLYFLV